MATHSRHPTAPSRPKTDIAQAAALGYCCSSLSTKTWNLNIGGSRSWAITRSARPGPGGILGTKPSSVPEETTMMQPAAARASSSAGNEIEASSDHNVAAAGLEVPPGRRHAA